MWEVCSVKIEVVLPADIAMQAYTVQREDFDFLSRVFLYGLTRRSIYMHLRDQNQDRDVDLSKRKGIALLGEDELKDILDNSIALSSWDVIRIGLDLRLPKDIAKEAEKYQRKDPEFLDRIVLYGLTKRSIYRHLRERSNGQDYGE